MHNRYCKIFIKFPYSTINFNLDYIIIFLEAVKKHPLFKSGKKTKLKSALKLLRASRDHDGRKIKRSKASNC